MYQNSNWRFFVRKQLVQMDLHPPSQALRLAPSDDLKPPAMTSSQLICFLPLSNTRTDKE